MKSVLEVIQSTTAFFTKAGVESPRLNIEHLLAHVLGKRQRMDLYLEFDRPLGENDLAPLRELVRRRAAGEPLQHLLGNVEFMGRTFKSDARALIPRPETEHLAQKLLERFATPPGRLADIGTGSGVLALTLAAEFQSAEVHACDISPQALALAAENAKALDLTEKVQFHQGHLHAPLGGTFDLIVANLPYVPSAEIASLAREVQRDPLLALDGGSDGAELLRELIPGVRLLLKGLLALEIGHAQSAPLAELLETSGYRDICREKDYSGRDRFLFASYG